MKRFLDWFFVRGRVQPQREHVRERHPRRPGDSSAYAGARADDGPPFPSVSLNYIRERNKPPLVWPEIDSSLLPLPKDAAP